MYHRSGRFGYEDLNQCVNHSKSITNNAMSLYTTVHIIIGLAHYSIICVRSIDHKTVWYAIDVCSGMI